MEKLPDDGGYSVNLARRFEGFIQSVKNKLNFHSVKGTKNSQPLTSSIKTDTDGVRGSISSSIPEPAAQPSSIPHKVSWITQLKEKMRSFQDLINKKLFNKDVHSFDNSVSEKAYKDNPNPTEIPTNVVPLSTSTRIKPKQPSTPRPMPKELLPGDGSVVNIRRTTGAGTLITKPSVHQNNEASQLQSDRNTQQKIPLPVPAPFSHMPPTSDVDIGMSDDFVPPLPPPLPPSSESPLTVPSEAILVSDQAGIEKTTQKVPEQETPTTSNTMTSAEGPARRSSKPSPPPMPRRHIITESEFQSVAASPSTLASSVTSSDSTGQIAKPVQKEADSATSSLTSEKVPTERDKTEIDVASTSKTVKVDATQPKKNEFTISRGLGKSNIAEAVKEGLKAIRNLSREQVAFSNSNDELLLSGDGSKIMNEKRKKRIIGQMKSSKENINELEAEKMYIDQLQAKKSKQLEKLGEELRKLREPKNRDNTDNIEFDYPKYERLFQNNELRCQIIAAREEMLGVKACVQCIKPAVINKILGENREGSNITLDDAVKKLKEKFGDGTQEYLNALGSLYSEIIKDESMWGSRVHSSSGKMQSEIARVKNNLKDKLKGTGKEIDESHIPKVDLTFSQAEIAHAKEIRKKVKEGLNEGIDALKKQYLSGNENSLGSITPFTMEKIEGLTEVDYAIIYQDFQKEMREADAADKVNTEIEQNEKEIGKVTKKLMTIDNYSNEGYKKRIQARKQECEEILKIQDAPNKDKILKERDGISEELAEIEKYRKESELVPELRRGFTESLEILTKKQDTLMHKVDAEYNALMKDIEILTDNRDNLPVEIYDKAKHKLEGLVNSFLLKYEDEFFKVHNPKVFNGRLSLQAKMLRQDEPISRDSQSVDKEKSFSDQLTARSISGQTLQAAELLEDPTTLKKQKGKDGKDEIVGTFSSERAETVVQCRKNIRAMQEKMEAIKDKDPHQSRWQRLFRK